MNRWRKMRSARVSGLALVVMLASGGMSWADPPMIIRYQARLTDTAGVPLTGVHEIAFSLFDQATDGTSLWSEGPSPVDLGSGSVDFLLGSSRESDQADQVAFW